MSIPIKDTLVLTGEDAKLFINRANRMLYAPKDKVEIARLKKFYSKCKHHLN